MASKEKRQVKLRQFIELAQDADLKEIPTDGMKVYANNKVLHYEVEIDPYLDTCKLMFAGFCTLDDSARDRLQQAADRVGSGHDFYGPDRYAGMSPEEAENWGKGTSREAGYDPN